MTVFPHRLAAPGLAAIAAALLLFSAPAVSWGQAKPDAKPAAKPADPKKPGDASNDGDADKGEKLYGIAMHGEPKYKPGFTHFDYVNPNAPKGGLFLIGETGTFNTLNPFTARANADIWTRLLVHGTLMRRSYDEPFSMYPYIAASVTMPKSRRWIEFHLDPRAKFSDGSPITPEDVIFSHTIIRTKGSPFWRSYFADVEKVEKTGPRSVKFTFKAKSVNLELPLIVAGDLPVLSKAYWEKRDFDKNTMEPPVGSGPYYISRVNPGSSITYKLVKDYWARDLATLKGYFNFGTWRAEYYKDESVAREALKGGDFDYRAENSASAWARQYEIDAAREGLLKKWRVPHKRTAGMQGFVFNTRNPLFADPRVRRAFVYVYDFEWANKNLFAGQYTRTKSYFDNSELRSRGLPEGDELALLQRYKGQIPDSVFTEPYTVPVFKNGRMRSGIRKAFRLLKAAGWTVKGKKLVHSKTGKPFEFTLLLVSPAFERVVLPYKQTLARLGIDMRVRLVSQAEYVKLVLNYKFDMIVGGWGQSLSPGNEQRAMWSSQAAKTPYSRNYSGISSKAVDELVELIISAPDRNTLITRVRALDRVLLHNHLVVPQWHLPFDRIVYWDKFGIPPPTALRGTQLLAWWIDPKKAAALKAKKEIRSLKQQD